MNKCVLSTMCCPFKYNYRIYPKKGRAHINAWAQINTEVQCCKVNKRLCKIQKGLVYMLG